jgi:hypothetical protein
LVDEYVTLPALPTVNVVDPAVKVGAKGALPLKVSVTLPGYPAQPVPLTTPEMPPPAWPVPIPVLYGVLPPLQLAALLPTLDEGVPVLGATHDDPPPPPAPEAWSVEVASQ